MPVYVVRSEKRSIIAASRIYPDEPRGGLTNMGNLRYTNLPAEVSNEDELAELALDVSFSWNRVADTLWSRLNPELWERTRNPWVVLQTVSSEKLKRITSEPA